MRISELSKTFNVTTQTVRNWLDAGYIKGATKKPSGRWFIPDDAIAQLGGKTKKRAIILSDGELFTFLAKNFCIENNLHIVKIMTNIDTNSFSTDIEHEISINDIDTIICKKNAFDAIVTNNIQICEL